MITAETKNEKSRFWDTDGTGLQFYNMKQITVFACIFAVFCLFAFLCFYFLIIFLIIIPFYFIF